MNRSHQLYILKNKTLLNQKKKKKMGTINDRNSKDLTEAEDIRRGGKNTQNYTKKIFMTQIITVV